MFMSFHILKTCIGNLSLLLISFFTLPPGLAHGRNADANPDWCAYIFVWRGEFCQVSIFAELICLTVGGYFFSILQN
jgi:hypothetical protein